MTKGIMKAKQTTKKTKKLKAVEFSKALEDNNGTYDALVIKNCKLTDEWDRVVVAKKLQEAKELVFKNCIFGMNMSTVEFPNDFKVLFENCTFLKNMYMVNSKAQTYKKCKFNCGLNINWAGDIMIEDSEWEDAGLDISCCNSIYMVNCKGAGINAEYIHERITLRESDIGLIEVNRSILEDLNLFDSNVNELYVTYSNIESMGICINNYKNIKKIKEISKLRLYKSGISCSLDLDISKVKLFEAGQTIITGNFHYEPDNIKEFDLEYTSGIVPPPKSIYLYKKCWYKAKGNHSVKPVIVKLEVPETAKRVYCENYKMRVSEAKVVELYDMDGKVIKRPKCPLDYSVYSGWDNYFKYRIGETVVPENDFDEKSGHCGSGIHGFIDFNDAVNYDL